MSPISPLLGMRQNITVDALINYLKQWCVKPEADSQEKKSSEEELEGANFTSTVQHIYNVYTYLSRNCSLSTLKELFQHNPAVYVEESR